MRKSWIWGAAAAMAWGCTSSAVAGEVEAKKNSTQLDEVSVTATRLERATKDVPASIAVTGRERMEQSRMFNVKDGLAGTPGVLVDSKNGGYDARLIIRGAGQKANYGIREINILRDGVPMTDPDSMSRLDFIDPQDIERIEVTKGPGSIYGGGSAGGVIQIISRSVFDLENRVRLGYGEQGMQNAHLRLTGQPTSSQALALTASHRAQQNEWRRWNEFDTQQLSLKHGLQLTGGGTWESEISYSQADLQLPGGMDQALFNAYKGSGRQTNTSEPWRHTGRYSEIWFLNSRLEHEVGAFTFRPRVYLTQWSHYHPVTGVVNVSNDNWVTGADLELAHVHKLLGDSSLVTGVTVRQDRNDDARKYKYAEVQASRGRILRTLSDRIGDLLSRDDTLNTLYGVYAMETLRPMKKLTLDVGVRYDRSEFEIDSNEIGKFDYGSGGYVAGAGQSSTDKSFNLWSPSLGLSYALTDHFSLFYRAARSDQVPSSSEIQSNTSLDAATFTNYEVGIKGRGHGWSLDLSTYYTDGQDEIVAVWLDGQTVFQNAGETEKKGVELAASYEVLKGVTLGGSYGYSDFSFASFKEVSGTRTLDQSGKAIPFVPRHQYGLFAEYASDFGLKARLQTLSWGSYWMDNGNSERYEGYEFLTNASVSYEWQKQVVTLSAENLFDEHYAVEAKKDARGTKSYSAGAPQTILLTWTMKF